MKLKRVSLHSLLALAAILLGACSSPPEMTARPDQDPVEPSVMEPTQTPEPAPEPSSEADPEDLIFAIAEGKTTLLVYAGEVRLSQDDGQTWGLAETGLWLVSGDRLQVSPGGLALILFPDSSLIRLEGFTDFKLVQSEFDFEKGDKRMIGRVLEGAVLTTTMPLPNSESLYQLWAMTSLLDLPYDALHAVPLDEAWSVPDEDRITFGAAIREDLEGEYLFNFADTVLPEYYVLESIDGDVVLIKTLAKPGQLTQLSLPFRDDIRAEYRLEGMLDTAAGLVQDARTAGNLEEIDFYGYSIIEEGPLNDDQTLYSVFPVDELDEVLAEADDSAEKQAFVRYVSSSPAYKRYQLHYRYFKDIPDIFAPEILLMLEQYNLGCDIESGLGCAVPEGCNQETGEGCTFNTGCNIITREGCARARLSCIAYTNCDVMACGQRPTIAHFCKPRVRTYCDPDLAGDCDQYLLTPAEQLDLLAAQMGPAAPDSQAGEPSQSPRSTQPGEEITFTYPLELVENPELAGEPLFDPNQPAELSPYYNSTAWDELTQTYQDLYGDFGDEDWDDEEDIEWCTCIAKVPPGYPPPPPWMDMTYRCWCSDPGAMR